MAPIGLLFAIALALLPTSHCGKGGDTFKILSCFPTKAEKDRCFSSWPRDQFHSKSFLAWLVPHVREDSYVMNGQELFDSEDFVISRVAHDPKYMCQHQDLLTKCVDCLTNITNSKCPHLPWGMFSYKEKTTEAFSATCSRLDEMDSVCIHTHWDSSHKCRKSLGDAWRNGAIKTSHISSQREKEAVNAPSSKNDSAATNSTRRAAWTKMDKDYCYFKYLTLDCMREATKTCSESTAHILFNISLAMSPESCVNYMQAWNLAQLRPQFMMHTAQHGASGGSSGISLHFPFFILTVIGAWKMYH